MVRSFSFNLYSLNLTHLIRRYQDRDFWIGLYNGGDDCGCFSDVAECEACRASWQWYEDTPMNWWYWNDGEPDGYMCGRITSESWADSSCGAELKYICERGKNYQTSSFVLRTDHRCVLVFPYGALVTWNAR